MSFPQSLSKLIINSRNMLFKTYFVCNFCERIIYRNICTSVVYCADKSKKRGLSFAQITHEVKKKTLKFINIWEGMTPRDLAIATGRPIEHIYEAMELKNLKKLSTTNDITNVCDILQFRCNVIAKQSYDMIGLVISPPIDYGPIKLGTKLEKRPPVVTIMGHVDHGKTTLLDALRNSEIVKHEHGGITQHIGAFVVSLNEQKVNTDDVVTFLDTPGHAAFKAMRQRGADATDIVVLVVASDDGVMEQTIESIKFANDADVSIIVAINKIDKVKNMTNSLEHLKRGLMAQSIILEEDGGDVQAIRMSALKGIGIFQLKEAILALAETLQLKAYTDGSVEAVVLESSVHPRRGKVASILVQNGTLKIGDVIWAGEKSWAKVRSMFDEWENVVQECRPGFPVQVIGWKDEHLPNAGDVVRQIENERRAKLILSDIKVQENMEKGEIATQESHKRTNEHIKTYKAELDSRRAAGIRYKRKKNIAPREKLIKDDDDDKVNIVLKCDVNGSLEVLLNIFESFPNDNSDVKLNLISYDVGAVSENDIELASCFNNTIIYSFNIGIVSPQITLMAKERNVRIKRFNVIYHLVDDLKVEISDKLPLLDEENVYGEAVVLQEFLINERNKKVPVAGAKCQKGLLKKSECLYKLKRRDEIIAKDLKISSMRHEKDEVNTIRKEFECGLRFEGIIGTDGIRFQPMDTLICYEIKKVKQTTKWTPPGF